VNVPTAAISTSGYTNRENNVRPAAKRCYINVGVRVASTSINGFKSTASQTTNVSKKITKEVAVQAFELPLPKPLSKQIWTIRDRPLQMVHPYRILPFVVQNNVAIVAPPQPHIIYIDLAED
jgi:hypothetical protein